MIAAALAAAVLSFRVVPLACTPSGLAIGGGGILRISPQGSCAGVVPGRAIAVTLDADGRAIPQKLDATAHPAGELPKSAYAFAPSSPAAAEGTEVTITIVVTIPPSTPSGSDIYLSTERSGFNPAEIAGQVKARRISVLVCVPKILNVLREFISGVRPEAEASAPAGSWMRRCACW